MTPTMIVVTVFALTLALSLLLPKLVKPLLVRLGIMDVPNERSSHERPVIRGVGLAVLIAMAAGYLAGLLSLAGSNDWGLLLVVTGASLASGVLGLGEDLRGVSVPVRSLSLLIIGGLAAAALVWPAWSTGAATFGWGGPFDRSELPLWVLLLLVVYAVLFISSYINVANFMDGLNGISGFHAVIAGLTFAAVGHVTEMTWLGVAGTVIAAGFLGFLPYNLTKPGAFLGDVGSYLLGGAVAVTSFAALMAGVPMLATIGPMVIYFGDVGVTLVKRVRAGYKWDEPHKEHTYQRIQQLGYSHTAASAIAGLCTAATSALGLVSLWVDGWWQLGLLALGFVILGVYLALPRLLPRGRSTNL